MTEPTYNTAILFGGNGFIGSNFAAYLLDNNIAKKVIISDFGTITPDMWPKSLQKKFAAGEVDYAKVDVRQPVAPQLAEKKLPADIDLIVNLAAVHKEPGHKAEEYFLTNIPGAENICAWAEQVNCDNIVFTSSIATYGGDETTKDENTLTMPLTPYGVSKLTAEKIHVAWQKTKPGRKLLIVRPGVIFGAGERGNVTRMVKAVLGHYFFFSGNKAVRKAGGYVKELCRSMAFMMNWQNEHNQGITLFNFTMDPAPSVGEYAIAISKVAGVKRATPNVPYRLLLTGSYLVHFINTLLGRKQSISPTTVRKVLKYNNIAPKILRDNGYEYEYTLEQGLADWYKERPQDW
ncbi:MAG TPA: NAD(P)-dependent oxidoreductase [Patescibacteria group bacterium]|jgi:nucleoside-diphosphate-sugar epimerase|nr:NAD(P)-dependent oxidoreductase [Patescibacteria group bacterium]